jgi:hypothetical protein
MLCTKMGAAIGAGSRKTLQPRPLARVTLVAALLFSPLSSHAQSAWVAPSTQKVRPSDKNGSATSATLEAAGNEFEAFHVVISGGSRGAKAISVSAGTLVGPGGATISDVRVYREGWYNVTTPSNLNGAVGRWPDAMIPAVDELDNQPRNAFPYYVPPNEQQPIFVELHVPPSAPPGWYTGAVQVTGGLTATVPVNLYVHAFTLPATASLRSAFGIGWDDACIAAFGGYTQCGGDAGVVALLTKYTKLALDHRVSLSDVVYAGPTQNSDGSYDWVSWDKIYSPMLDGNMAGRLVGARLTTVRYQWTVDPAHYKAWADHFAARGWLDRTFDYTCDEPPDGCPFSAIAPRAAMVHAANPGFATLVTTTIAQAKANGVLGSIDTLVPVVDLVDPMPPATNARAQYDAWLGQSGTHRVWMYQSCDSHGCIGPGGPLSSGWPSYMIDAPATLNRAMEWQSWRERVSGELYYDTTYALSRGDAWTNQYYFAGNGDGTLFYPGTPAKVGGTSQIPVASLRLKMIREGQEDYEYLKLLADAGDPKMADAEAAGLSPAAYNDVSDPALVDAARHRIALRIEQLTQQKPPPMYPADGGAVSDGSPGNGGMPATSIDGGVMSGGGVGGNGADDDGGATTANDPPPSSGPQHAVTRALHGGCSHGGRAPHSWPVTLALALVLVGLGWRRRR